jgi:gamma-glutamylcyclotransferase (GGCT)/AIG2-like uncharacterized protein YtfP
MSHIEDRVFVYGTLQRGEERSGFMEGCGLTTTFAVPGRLYDTGRGYPAAVFDMHSRDMVHGELYRMDNPAQKISELDHVEGTESGLFRRVGLNYGGVRFHCYEPGTLLEGCVREENRIRSGNWRGSSSLAITDPVAFAVNFENGMEKIYKKLPSEEGEEAIYVKGSVPLLITAPHATAHVRMNKLKRHEFYTGALGVLLHSLTGCHVFYTNCQSEPDPNYYDESPFKTRLAEVVCNQDIRFLIDLHGTGAERTHDIFPGVGEQFEFLLGNEHYLEQLERAADNCGIALGGLDVFPAARQMTVTKFAAMRLGIPAVQLEINRALRRPASDPDRFERLVEFLRRFIDSVT